MLKTLLLRSKIDKATKALEELRKKDADFDKREQEIRSAFEEVNEETTAEEREAVEASIAKFDDDKAEHEKEKQTLSDEISGYEKELAEAEAQQEPKAPAQEPVKEEPKTEERSSYKNMKTRFLQRMSASERKEFIEREDTKKFLANIRTAIKEKRNITGAELLIPEIAMPMLRSETEQYSKLLKHVNVMDIPGKGRQTIAGDIPEAVWTEACATLNEVNLSFTQIEFDGFKVGAYVIVCNALLEDSDIDLADEIFYQLGQAGGYAIDKAIVYGTGTKMPTGFSKNITKVATGGTGKALFAKIMKAVGSLGHAFGDLVWVCNTSTYYDLMAEAVDFNANAVVVANGQTGISETKIMPLVGGAVEILDFVPDGEILGGYLKRYTMVRRRGEQLAVSTDCKFVEDQTVFKYTSRYDGKPAFGDAFVAMSLTATAPTGAIDTAHPFASDKANAGK